MKALALGVLRASLDALKSAVADYKTELVAIAVIALALACAKGPDRYLVGAAVIASFLGGRKFGS